jgi:hypothetical protein
MLEYIREEANTTFTENGAVTHESTGSECLDLFATIGALRRESDEEIITRFVRAYTEDADTAMKILFYSRDIRGGLGERRVFRVIMKWLADNEPESVLKNLNLFSEFGRFDDLLSLFGTVCEKAMLDFVGKGLQSDIDALKSGSEVSLLAKWLPSVNASKNLTVMQAKAIAKHLKMSDETYRKTLVALRSAISIIENSLRERDYSFDYEKQPSRAMHKYRKAFIRNDGIRYSNFLSKVEESRAVLHADNISPYELVEPYLISSWYEERFSFVKNISAEEKRSINAAWRSLPDYGNKENILAVIDTSGSMYSDGQPTPAAVALSLGLYFAEHNKGHFRNTFIEFSEKPRLIELKGDTFADRLRYACSLNEVANTNIEAVFDLVLSAAVKNNVSQSELPSKLIIVSDMEFDECVHNTSLSNFMNAKKRFAENGYMLPEVVFWNVASRNRQQPVRKNEQGVVLISGTTPRIFSMVAGNNLSPYDFMLEVIGSKRYAEIIA